MTNESWVVRVFEGKRWEVACLEPLLESLTRELALDIAREMITDGKPVQIARIRRTRDFTFYDSFEAVKGSQRQSKAF